MIFWLFVIFRSLFSEKSALVIVNSRSYLGNPWAWLSSCGILTIRSSPLWAIWGMAWNSALVTGSNLMYLYSGLIFVILFCSISSSKMRKKLQQTSMTPVGYPLEKMISLFPKIKPHLMWKLLISRSSWLSASHYHWSFDWFWPTFPWLMADFS